MKKYLIPLMAFNLLLLSNFGHALSAAGERYINMISAGGPTSVRDAAKSIRNSGENDTAVLDMLAERMLSDYHKTGRNEADATAWSAIALGDSGNSRYYSAVKEVADKGEGKLAKHAAKALKNLKQSDVPQYTKGMVSLTNAREAAIADQPKPVARAAQNDGRYVPLSEIKEGMSMAEVSDLAGPPTATTSHITGKAFRPFNFRGNDTARTYYLYKGQGRVVFSNDSRYSSSSHVQEVILDPEETGYP